MRTTIILLLSVLIFSCEKDINPDLEAPAEVIVIDAWVNDKPEPQNIFITRSQTYFDNEFPEKVSGATVVVFDELGEEFFFEENDSAYTWTGGDSLTFGNVGMMYTLAVDVEGERFVALARMGRVPDIDSIKFTFEEANAFITQDFYLAEFVARDPEGVGDTYWIKAWKNGKFLNKPSEINFAYDAGFTAGGIIDGQVFIQPIQSAINPFDVDPDNENEILPPYLVGDSVYTEIHSIDAQGFDFLAEMQVQTDRSGGFGALFAVPLANVPTNLLNADENSTVMAAGFFQVSAVSALGKLLDSETAAEARFQAEFFN